MPTAHDIARWRLQSQHLVAPYAGSAASVVTDLLAVQAENPSQAAWAVASRTAHADPADLEALLDAGEVVRTHVLRPTWHFVPAADIAWLLELTAPRVRPVVARQLTEVHGWTPETIDRVTTAVVELLGEEPDRTRDEVARGLSDRGFEITGQPLMLLLAQTELDRLVCSGRPRSGTHTYALFADRVREPARLDREGALGELALRYFTGHGPATVRDLSYWATLTVTDVRRGLTQVEDRLESFEHDGLTFWHAPGEAPRSPQDPPGTCSRSSTRPTAAIRRAGWSSTSRVCVPTGRETAIGMALVDAQLVARMKRTVGKRVVFELSPYRAALRPGELDALEEAAARYGAFLGLEHELVISRRE